MRVAMIYLSGGGLSGGAATTLRTLVPLLEKDDRVERLDVFLPPAAAECHFDAETTVGTWPRWDRLTRWRNLRAQIRRLRPDVVFIPTAAWLDCGAIPTVSMVRNMEAAQQPFGDNPLMAGFKNLLRRRQAKLACRQADRVIAVSRFVRDFLVENWSIPAGKIGVVYHGVNPAIPPAEMTCPKILAAGPPERFWFTAGSILPYRGLEDVIGAMAARPDDEQLLIAGASVYSDAYKNRMRELAESLGIAGRITWLGHLPPDEMAWCFRHCEAFVMTSRVEACPNLVLEALSHGCLSVSDTNPPMPEMFGNCASYYPTGQPDDLARQLETVRQMSGDDRAKLGEAARLRAAEFSWANTAANTIRQLQQAIEDARGKSPGRAIASEFL